jgi:hypothetical protein
VREKYGEKYRIVTYEDRADEPLAAARAAAGELRDASISGIRKEHED